MRRSLVPVLMVLLAASCGSSEASTPQSAATAPSSIAAVSTTLETPSTSESPTTTEAPEPTEEPSCEVLAEIATLDQGFDVAVADRNEIETYLSESVRLRERVVDLFPSRLKLNARGALTNAEFFAELAEGRNYDLDIVEILVEGAVDAGVELNTYELSLVSFADSQCEVELVPLRSNLWP